MPGQQSEKGLWKTVIKMSTSISALNALKALVGNVPDNALLNSENEYAQCRRKQQRKKSIGVPETKGFIWPYYSKF